MNYIAKTITYIITFVSLLATSTSLSAANLTIFQKDGKYGLIDQKTRKDVVSAKFDLISPANNGWFSVMKKDKYGLFSPEGKEYLKCNYEDIIPQIYTTSAKGQPMFWAKRKGVYRLESSKGSEKQKYLKIAISPDSKFYGKLPKKPGYWENVDRKSEPFPADDNNMIAINYDNGFKLFNRSLFRDESIIETDIDNCRELTFNGQPYLYTGKSIILMQAPYTVYERIGQPDITDETGVYVMKGTKRRFIIQNKLFCELTPSKIGEGVYIVEDKKSYNKGMLFDDTILKPIFSIISEQSGSFISKEVMLLHLKGPKTWTIKTDVQNIFSQLQKKSKLPLIIVATDGERSDIYGLSDKMTRMYGEENFNIQFKDNLIFFTTPDDQIPLDRSGASTLSFFEKYTYNPNNEQYTIYDHKGGMGTAQIDTNGIITITQWPKSEPAPAPVKPKYTATADIWASCNGYKPDLWTLVYDDDSVGLCDPDGVEIIPPIYQRIDTFDPFGAADDRPAGQYWWWVKDHSGKWGVIDHKGKILIPFGAYNGCNSILGRVYKNGKMGVLDPYTLKLVIPCLYSEDLDGGIIYGNIGKGRNRRVALGYETGNKVVIDIWTLGGKKIASKTFACNARYSMASFIESQLNVMMSW